MLDLCQDLEVINTFLKSNILLTYEFVLYFSMLVLKYVRYFLSGFEIWHFLLSKGYIFL